MFVLREETTMNCICTHMSFSNNILYVPHTVLQYCVTVHKVLAFNCIGL